MGLVDLLMDLFGGLYVWEIERIRFDPSPASFVPSLKLCRALDVMMMDERIGFVMSLTGDLLDFTQTSPSPCPLHLTVRTCWIHDLPSQCLWSISILAM
jgi:hypothetical protein